VFYAPLLLDDAESALALRRQPSVAEAMEQISRVTLAVVGIGGWVPRTSTIWNAASDEDREAISNLGVIGEVAGVFYNAAGQPVATPLDERLLTITAEQMRGIPEVIGVAYGAAKAETIRASVLGGLVDSLVVDSEVARRMLQG
jgi:DNA-binding transcriptional regulator LsrR (DeoR family)